MQDKAETQNTLVNIRLYPWYAAVIHAHFWMPVFILYFLKHMPLADVLRLEAIYYLGVVLLEAPSGYFSDRFGRRPTLLIANAALLAAYLVFILGGSISLDASDAFNTPAFAVFALGQLLLAVGLAFNSGTDTSMHYDSLRSASRAEEFAPREAQAARNGILASGLAGLIGGAVGVLDLRLAYMLSALAALAGLAIVIAMYEPGSQQRQRLAQGPIAQLRTCARLLDDSLLRWIFAFTIVMTVLNHVPYEFYQPYIDMAIADTLTNDRGSPFAAGVHVALVMAIAAWFAHRSIRLRDRFGLRLTLLAAAILQTGVILAMGLLLHPLIILLVLLRSAPRAMMTAPVNAAIAPRIDSAQRATYLSIQSLAGRLAFSIWLTALSFIPASNDDGGWAGMSTKLLVSAGLGLIAATVLTFTSRRLHSRPASPPPRHDEQPQRP